MDCPCETCLVRPTCGSKLIQKRRLTKYAYLIIEYTEECPYILEYFGTDFAGNIDHNYDKIYKLCRLFGAHEGNYFVWKANQLK